MSESETKLWQAIRYDRLGFRVRRQYPVGGHVLDFFVHEAMLCIEVDGEQHAFKLARDACRDQVLSAKGIATLRIPSIELFTNLDSWVDTIFENCCRRTGRNPFA